MLNKSVFYCPGKLGTSEHKIVYTKTKLIILNIDYYNYSLLQVTLKISKGLI